MDVIKSILPVAQIIISVALSAAILLQQRGSGLSATFGGDGSSYRTRRGLEKVLFNFTLALILLLLLSAILTIIL